jgi:pimeloyl-ACP methyl ester carboxylesterase
VWYRIVGATEPTTKLPLLTLHGGPGAAHDYLESLDAMAEHGRKVIYYDQLGCGHSSTPSNPSMWTIDLYKEEIDGNSEWIVFEQSSHMAHAEEPERYMETLDNFLNRIEARPESTH